MTSSKIRHMPSRRMIGLCEASTYLRIARDACKEATATLNASVADVDNDPMWDWSKESHMVSNQIDALRKSVQAEMWKG